uniref:Cytochrome c oxidase subunit 3 n=1 Tax=Aspidiphorus orbiculatus TaxID=577441 RepID=A0A0S2M6H8_9CUCU|nr:cytochrome c oxidase subunit 3 [Aspidiphorus orbiculatus]
MKNHPFHLVDFSPWPLITSFLMMNFMMGMIKWFHTFNMNLLLMSVILLMLTSYQWWRDIVRESTLQGHHTINVTNGLKLGMILFIISEVFFFISFFWSFFHSSLAPSIELGMEWPPKMIQTFDPLKIPFLNTLILLTSGLTVTWAHHSLMENNFQQTNISLMITVTLGIIFTFLQGFEYLEASFTITDSVFGATFFMATGFHGLHVIIGTTFLAICLIRQFNNHFSMSHHFGFEAAAWYWHFVDIVWLYLYISIYWWGS